VQQRAGQGFEPLEQEHGAGDYTAPALRSGSVVAKAAGPAVSPARPSMSAILMIAAFLVVLIALNIFEYGRAD
jgi:hypothetical protein